MPTNKNISQIKTEEDLSNYLIEKLTTSLGKWEEAEKTFGKFKYEHIYRKLGWSDKLFL